MAVLALSTTATVSATPACTIARSGQGTMRSLLMAAALFATAAAAQDETCEAACGNPSETHWRGLVVAPEDRCSDYSAGHYTYPASIEADIVQALGGIFSPYTGEWFDRTQQTDIEHIVARSEAHDSGMCAHPVAVRRLFASDLLNLTLADPTTNRREKRHYDAADWLPDVNQCWFAARVVEVRRKWALTRSSGGYPYARLCLIHCI